MVRRMSPVLEASEFTERLRCSQQNSRWILFIYLNVFVCGDMDSKVQRMMHSYSLEESAAVERIKETDKQRKKYYSYYTGGDWEAASNYDLCLNTGDMSIEEAAEQILFYLKQKKYI